MIMTLATLRMLAQTACVEVKVGLKGISKLIKQIRPKYVCD
jgi:hypothetical protein